MFGDGEWLWGNWQGQGEPDATQAFGVDADITGDGEYTVSITNASIAYDDPTRASTHRSLLTATMLLALKAA